MRITQSMIVRSTLQRINYCRDNLNTIQRRISTQKRVEKPSDDPFSFSRSSRFRTALGQNEQFLKNVGDADSWISTSSIALDQLYDYAVEAKCIAQQGADGSLSADERIALAERVYGMLEDSVALGNKQYLGKSIFAGTNTKNPSPFTLTGNVTAYSGNDENIYRKISEDKSTTINVTGQDIFDTNIFTEMGNLVDALNNNNVPAIQNCLDQFNTISKDMLTISTSAASQITSLQLVENRLTSGNINLMSYISDEEDALLEEEIVKFEAEELAYQAALQSSAKIMNMNILNYLQ